MTRKKGFVVFSIEAAVLAAWVALTSDLPFLVALVFFLLCRPGAAMAADAVANHLNPGEPPGEPPTIVVGAGLLILPIIAALLTGAWMFWQHRGAFLPTYSYVLMGCAAAGAVNGILMEWEDNQPGGWLNPTRKD